MGGALTALAPDLHRSVLGVARHELLDAPQPERRLGGLSTGRSSTPPTPTRSTSSSAFALMQMLWDRGETNGYAQHMTDDPLPEHAAPTRSCSSWASPTTRWLERHRRGRGPDDGGQAGDRRRRRRGCTGRSTRPSGSRPSTGDTADVGSIVVNWFSDGTGLHTPPHRQPARCEDGDRPPRGAPGGTARRSTWPPTGSAPATCVDTCGAGACVIPAP